MKIFILLFIISMVLAQKNYHRHIKTNNKKKTTASRVTNTSPSTVVASVPSKSTENQLHCVFIHGVGTLPGEYREKIYEDVENLPKPLRDYWGDMEWTKKIAGNDRYCTSYAIILMDTVHKGWKEHADITCKALKPHLPQNIYLHSMGNLTFYNAIKECPIDNKKDLVFSLAPPIEGAKIVHKLAEECAKIVKKSHSRFGKLEAKVFEGMNNLVFGHSNTEEAEKFLKEKFLTFCTKDGKPQPAFASCLPENVPAKILEVANENVTGAVCGSNNKDSKTYRFLNMLTKNAEHSEEKKGKNDGVVWASSCRKVLRKGRATKYRENNKRLFFSADLNHEQISGRNNDERMIVYLEYTLSDNVRKFNKTMSS